MDNTEAYTKASTDPRFGASAVPSITGIRLSNGNVVNVEAKVVNISRSGILIEGRTRFSPGTRVTIMFDGTFEPSVVKGTIVRCLVSSIDGGALQYQSGIAFQKRLKRSPVEKPAAALTVSSHSSTIDIQKSYG